MEVGVSEPMYLILPQAQLPSMAASGVADLSALTDIVSLEDVESQCSEDWVLDAMLEVKKDRNSRFSAGRGDAGGMFAEFG